MTKIGANGVFNLSFPFYWICMPCTVAGDITQVVPQFFLSIFFVCLKILKIVVTYTSCWVHPFPVHWQLVEASPMVHYLSINLNYYFNYLYINFNYYFNYLSVNFNINSLRWLITWPIHRQRYWFNSYSHGRGVITMTFQNTSGNHCHYI